MATRRKVEALDAAFGKKEYIVRNTGQVLRSLDIVEPVWGYEMTISSDKHKNLYVSGAWRDGRQGTVKLSFSDIESLWAYNRSEFTHTLFTLSAVPWLELRIITFDDTIEFHLTRAKEGGGIDEEQRVGYLQILAITDYTTLVRFVMNAKPDPLFRMIWG